MTNCLACGGQLSKEVSNRDYFSRESFKVCSCGACGFAATEVPEDIDLEKYYPPNYYGKQNRRFHPLIEKMIGYFRGKRGRFISSLVDRDQRSALDIGCGRALMLRDLAQQGWKVQGIELSDTSSQYAREVCKVPVARDLDDAAVRSQKFGVVSLWHVLEHVPRPMETLLKARELLAEGGKLVIEVPNFASWQAQLNPATWIYLETPRHLFHFTPESLDRLLTESGYRVTHRSTFSLEYGFYGMFQSLLNMVTPDENFLFFILRNNTGAVATSGSAARTLGLISTAIFAIPFGLLSIALELAAVAVGRGGCYRIVAQKPGMKFGG